jgi:hypothetical protein
MSANGIREPKGTSIVQQELEWLDRLRVALEPNVTSAVNTLVELSKTSARESVRAMAASKIVGLYAQCAVDSAALKLKDKDSEPDTEDKFRVLVVTPEQLGEASEQLAASYQAKRALAKDVS